MKSRKRCLIKIKIMFFYLIFTIKILIYHCTLLVQYTHLHYIPYKARIMTAESLQEGRERWRMFQIECFLCVGRAETTDPGPYLSHGAQTAFQDLTIPTHTHTHTDHKSNGTKKDTETRIVTVQQLQQKGLFSPSKTHMY